MPWLAIETSSPSVSLAIGKDDTILREMSREGNASTLIDPLFKELNVDLQAIDRVVIGKGPGSYNGLRVGYAFLKGLLCLAPLPVVEVPTSLILASLAIEKTPSAKTILLLQNARREELYAAFFEISQGKPHMRWEEVAPEKVIFKKTEGSRRTIVSYDMTTRELPQWTDAQWLALRPTASMAGRLAHQLKLPPARSLSELEPHYVRAPVSSPAIAAR